MKHFNFAVIPAVTKTFSKNILLLNFLYYIYNSLQNRAFINPCMQQQSTSRLSIVQGLAFELFQSKYNYWLSIP